MADQFKLKAFVRVDGTGKVIPGGPIFQAHKPKVGKWRQINAKECCNYTPSTTTTTSSSSSSTTSTTSSSTSSTSTTSTSTTAAPTRIYRMGATGYLNYTDACTNSGDISSGANVYMQGYMAPSLQVYTNIELTNPFTGTGWYPLMNGYPSGTFQYVYLISGVINGYGNC